MPKSHNIFFLVHGGSPKHPVHLLLLILEPSVASAVKNFVHFRDRRWRCNGNRRLSVLSESVSPWDFFFLFFFFLIQMHSGVYSFTQTDGLCDFISFEMFCMLLQLLPAVLCCLEAFGIQQNIYSQNQEQINRTRQGQQNNEENQKTAWWNCISNIQKWTKKKKTWHKKSRISRKLVTLRENT